MRTLAEFVAATATLFVLMFGFAAIVLVLAPLVPKALP